MTTTPPPFAPPPVPPVDPAPGPPPGSGHGSRFAVVGRLLLVVALVGTVGIAFWVTAYLVGSERADDLPTTLPIVPADVQPGAEVPVAPGAQLPAGSDPVAAWADRTASTVEVPARALRAYGFADLAMRSEAPRCRVTWATLAGIGRIESDHGRFGGSALRADGRPARPIVGVALDGSPGLAAIADTDDGILDGDRTHDRAVGPMQFIPSTWARWAADADGDGRADPQDIDDAALAAGRYLCAGGRDIGTAKGWWAAVFSYNNSVEYGQKVFGLADTYARRSLG